MPSRRNSGRPANMKTWTLSLPLQAVGVTIACLLASCASPCTTEAPKGFPFEKQVGCAFCGLARAGLFKPRKNYTWTEEEVSKRFRDPIQEPRRHWVKFESGKAEFQKLTITILHPKEPWNGRILWYFHGVCANGYFTDDLSGEETLKIYDSFTRGKPIVITLGLETFRVIDPDNMTQFLNTMDEAFELAVPDPNTRRHTRHWALGISMGGLNGLQTLMFEDRGYDFERAVFVAPYIPRCDAYLGDGCEACLEDEAARGKGEKSYFHKLSRTGLRAFFSEEQWAVCNPLAYARMGGFNHRKDRVMIVWGSQDMFGFDVTSQELASLTGFVPISGCWDHQMPNNDEDLLKMAAFLEGGID